MFFTVYFKHKEREQMKKVLTVAIPTYNMEKYLENCLNSFIYDSTMTDVEVLIINDGSKDNSLNIAKRYEENYPNIFKVVDKENGGHGSTINKALSMATGKYFRVVDADDWVDTEQFRKLVEILNHTDADSICTNFTNFYELDNKKEINDVCLNHSGEYKISEIKDYKFAMHSMVYKTELIKEVRLLEHCFYVDVLYNIYCYNNCDTILYIPDLNIYQYRLGRAGQSVSMDGFYKHRENHTKVLKTGIPFIYSLSDETKKQVLINYISNIANNEYSIYIYNYGQHPESLQEIIEFDSWLKNYDEIYCNTNISNVKQLRNSGFKKIKCINFKIKIKNFVKKCLGR